MLIKFFAGILTLIAFAGPAQAALQFFGTSTPTGNWFVSTTVSQTEGLQTNFGINPFTQAVNLATPTRQTWIADVPSGSHGGVGNWTYFVFRQTFDLAGYDPATTNLTFRWAADDSGEIHSTRGSWIPAFTLNGGAFVNYIGSTPSARIPTYSFSAPQSISSGFVAGLNTLDFYVQGNGQTDGFALDVVSFTAAIPEPSAVALLAPAALLAARRRL